jgi:chromosome partitioning protein
MSTGVGPEVVVEVAPGLGWPRRDDAHPGVGWPDVPRETIEWPTDPAVVGSSPGATQEDPPELESADRELVGPLVPEPSTVDEESPLGEAVPQTVTDVVDAPTVEPVIPRAPGPRRARFDEDELAARVEVPDDLDVPRETRGRVLPLPRQRRTFVIANQKGGVGKTTTSVNLATALALGGLRVLVVDLDPQGNASTALGVDHSSGVAGTYEVLIRGDRIADHVVDSPEAPGLTVLPATLDLAGAEIELVSVVARERRLIRALDRHVAEHPVDYVLLDCPPSLGLLTLNALVAATEILIPIQCEYYALEGVSQLVRTIDLVKGELNDQLQLSTVLLTMFDGRTRLSAQVADEVRRHFPTETLAVAIPRSVRISEAPSYGQSVLTYHPDSVGAVSYLKAAEEIARRGAEEAV